MNTKIEPIFHYEGLGFPIELTNVVMVNIQGEWHPKIDVHYVADNIIKKLAYQKERLTGSQVKFIRTYFAMPLRKFGETVVHESHTAISKWEKQGHHITRMNENTERVLRLYIIEQTQTKREQKDFFSKYQSSSAFLTTEREEPVPLQLNCA